MPVAYVRAWAWLWWSTRTLVSSGGTDSAARCRRSLHQETPATLYHSSSTGWTQEPGRRAGSAGWPGIHPSVGDRSPFSVGCCPIICPRHRTLTDPQTPGLLSIRPVNFTLSRFPREPPAVRTNLPPSRARDEISSLWFVLQLHFLTSRNAPFLWITISAIANLFQLLFALINFSFLPIQPKSVTGILIGWEQSRGSTWRQRSQKRIRSRHVVLLRRRNMPQSFSKRGSATCTGWAEVTERCHMRLPNMQLAF